MKKLIKGMLGALCTLLAAVSQALELPDGYTALDAVASDGAQYLDVGYAWKDGSSATCVSEPTVTVGSGTDWSRFLEGTETKVSALRIYESGDLVCDMTSVVANVSGEFGLYDLKRVVSSVSRVRPL